MPPPTARTTRYFTIDVDGIPTVVLEANSFREAGELCHEDWFRADLSVLTSAGDVICTSSSKLRARAANSTEAEKYAKQLAGTSGSSDDLSLVYLVPIDR